MVVGGEAAALQDGQFPGDAKPQAKVLLVLAGRIGPIEAFKYPLLILVRDLRALIPEADGQDSWTMGGWTLAVCLYADLPACRCIRKGIVQQDGQDLGQTLRVGPDLRERILREIEEEADFFLAA